MTLRYCSPLSDPGLSAGICLLMKSYSDAAVPDFPTYCLNEAPVSGGPAPPSRLTPWHCEHFPLKTEAPALACARV